MRSSPLSPVRTPAASISNLASSAIASLRAFDGAYSLKSHRVERDDQLVCGGRWLLSRWLHDCPPARRRVVTGVCPETERDQ
jgi:hypothetical protein